MTKILFTYKKLLSTFVSTEIDILRQMGIVDLYRFEELKKKSQFWEFIKQFLYLLFHKPDIYYCFFADYHSFLPVFFAKVRKKKSVIVVAGYDSTGIKESYWSYGIFVSKKWRIWMARYIYKNATHILTVADALQESLAENGIKIDERFKTVYFGWREINTPSHGFEQPYALMVGVVDDMNGFFRKGYDRLITLAEMNPELRFVAIGLNISLPRGYNKPDNLTIISQLRHDSVLKMMGGANVYLQPSRYEGMPNAIAEAMLLGCEIVASDVCGIPELVKFYTFNFNDDKVLTKISTRLQLLLEDDKYFSDFNRNRIIGNFNINKRKDAIEAILYSF